jgi:hypothetical protein
MQRVQKDLEQLKKKLTEQDYVMRRSDKIAALEKEVEWYKQECVMQRQQVEALTEENEKVRKLAEERALEIRELEYVLSKY